MKKIPSESERKSLYTTLDEKNQRVREEHSMKDEHKENFGLGNEGISSLYDRIFASKKLEISIRGLLDSSKYDMDDLMNSISLTPELFKIYVASGVTRIVVEAQKRGLPREHALDIQREIFLKLADAKSTEEIGQISILAAEEFNRRYRIYCVKTYSYPVRCAIEQIHKKRYKKISANTIAADVKCERTHLAKIFKEETGYTITEYITKAKMETAVDILQTHTYALSEIAELLSYSSYARFNEKFRKYYGVSPKDYEKNQ